MATCTLESALQLSSALPQMCGAVQTSCTERASSRGSSTNPFAVHESGGITKATTCTDTLEWLLGREALWLGVHGLPS